MSGDRSRLMVGESGTMLDLNVSGGSRESRGKRQSAGHGSDSGTSDSSVLNADASPNVADENSISTPIQFSILKSSEAGAEAEAEEQGGGGEEGAPRRRRTRRRRA